MAERRIYEAAGFEHELKSRCGWLADAIGPKLWAEFARGARFFLNTHPETDIRGIARLLTDNKDAITQASDAIVRSFGYKENMRQFLTAYAATAAIIGTSYKLDPAALMAFVTKECPRDARLLEREFRRMKGAFQLSPGNIARAYARDPADHGVRYDVGLIKKQLASYGTPLDFDALRKSSFMDRTFLARNPFANMVGATLTISLIMKRQGLSVIDTYIRDENWRSIAKRYNAAAHSTLYANTYMENLRTLKENVSFSGWQPKMEISRLEDEKRKVYRKTQTD